MHKAVGVVSAACLLTACTGQQHHIDRAGLALSTAAIVVDWGQTYDAAARGWVGNAEANSLLGPAPSTRGVSTYFVSAIVLNAALWYVLPRGWRSAASAGVILLEAPTIIDNRNRTEFLGFGTPPGPSVVRQIITTADGRR